jgi:hypothetical protein
MKNSHSSIGKLINLIPVRYLALKPQMPHLVKITSQIMNGIPAAATPKSRPFHLDKNLILASKPLTIGVNIMKILINK